MKPPHAQFLVLALILLFAAQFVHAQGTIDDSVRSVAGDTVDAAPSKLPPSVSESLTEIPWHTDLQDATNAAADSNRHIIANFYTDWCKWCRLMDDSTFTDPDVIAATKRFVFLKINAEADTTSAGRFGVSVYPTIVLLDKTGNEVDRVTGYHRPRDLLKRMDEYVDGIGTLWALEKEARSKRNDAGILYAIAEKYIGRSDFEKAREMLKKVLSYDSKNTSGFSDNAQFALGVLLRREKSWFKAAEAFKTMIKKYPDSELREDAEIYIAWSYEQAGDTKEALKRYHAFLKEFGKSSETDWVKSQIKRLENPPEDESSS